MALPLPREAALRLPGVYFLPAAASQSPALPPLHEAAFVGFAPYGPLDRPVPVDSAAAYAAVFGGELALARDADGRLINAHLRSAVLGFFANGGRRAHVIRVAGPQQQTAAYTLRGLQSFTPGPPGTRLTPHAVRIEAASPGAWANTLEIALQLDERALPPASFRVVAGNELRWQAGPAPQAVLVGDLLRIVFTDGRARLFPVSAIDAEASATDPGAVTLRAACVTATRLRHGQLLSTRLPPARPHRVERLRLIPWWRQADEVRRSPVELAFNAGGPGYWADALPLASSRAADAGWIAETLTSAARPRPAERAAEGVAARIARLFRRLAGDEQFDWNADGVAERALLGARFAPFPAVDQKTEHATPAPPPLFLPDALSPWSPADDDWIGADRLGDDDLAERGAAASRVFLDPDLDRLLPPPHLPDPLLATAWHQQYVSGQRLRGAHAFFGLASAALLAAPDAVQPDWAPAPAPLAIDGFAPAGGALDGGTTLTVSGHGFVRDRTHLRLGGRPIERLRVIDAQTLICRTPAASAPGFATLELRIGGAAPANPATRIEPGFAYRAMPAASDFSACAGAPQIDRVSPAFGAAAGTTVRLRGRRFVEPLGVRFGGLPARSLRRVSERLIVCVAPALPAGQAVDVEVESAGGRALCAGGFLPRDTRQAAKRLPLVGDPRDFSSDQLLAVQRELLVICAARADAVAILALPRHFRRRDCIAWRGALAGRLGELTGGDALASREDVSVDSYGAVYHPWLKIATDDQRAVPPDGAACGMIAARELARQVWIAPARVALVGAVGLDLQLADGEAADLTGRQFNLLRAEAGQILPITAHTLDAGRSLNQLSVRRLLILLRKWLLERGAELTFATHDERFREAVKVELDRLLGRLHALGAFAGSTPAAAFRVSTDASVNPPASVDAGRFVAIVQVAPSQPGEFILVRLERNGAGELRLSGG